MPVHHVLSAQAHIQVGLVAIDALEVSLGGENSPVQQKVPKKLVIGGDARAGRKAHLHRLQRTIVEIPAQGDKRYDRSRQGWLSMNACMSEHRIRS